MFSRVIGKLDSYGLINRLRDPDDFRAARAEITPKGRTVYERITAQRSAVISESVTGLPADQQAALVAALPALENLAEDLRARVGRGTGSGTHRRPTDPRQRVFLSRTDRVPATAHPREPPSPCPKPASLPPRLFLALLAKTEFRYQ